MITLLWQSNSFDEHKCSKFWLTVGGLFGSRWIVAIFTRCLCAGNNWIFRWNVLFYGTIWTTPARITITLVHIRAYLWHNKIHAALDKFHKMCYIRILIYDSRGMIKMFELDVEISLLIIKLFKYPISRTFHVVVVAGTFPLVYVWELVYTGLINANLQRREFN